MREDLCKVRDDSKDIGCVRVIREGIWVCLSSFTNALQQMLTSKVWLRNIFASQGVFLNILFSLIGKEIFLITKIALNIFMKCFFICNYCLLVFISSYSFTHVTWVDDVSGFQVEVPLLTSSYPTSLRGKTGSSLKEQPRPMPKILKWHYFNFIRAKKASRLPGNTGGGRRHQHCHTRAVYCYCCLWWCRYCWPTMMYYDTFLLWCSSDK